VRAGYDRFFGIAAGAADYFTYGEAPDGKTPGLYEQDERAVREGYLTDLIADRAVEEVQRSAGSGRPFLISLHFNAPHWPWEGPKDAAVPPTLTDLWHRDGGSLETYGAMVGAMDSAIGRVLDALERSGVAGETIVIFTSDNGGERYSDMWPLRGGKGELLEGGIRVPSIVRWPGRVPPGSRSDQVMASFDWLPTLASAAGAATDSRFPPDGEDLLGVLEGRERARSRRLFWRHRGKSQAAARDGDWKYLRYDGEEYLFNIPRDPREQANLKAREPSTFKRLRDAYAEWNSQMLPYPAEKKGSKTER
jgi:arylsulfatase A-like enzyme